MPCSSGHISADQPALPGGKGENMATEMKTDLDEEINYRYDTQLLIEGENLDEDEIRDYIDQHFVGDCLLVVGDEELIKLHFHTNEPWKILEYCSTLGEIFDIVIEDMYRQAAGKKG
jgi:dihydroxyacetone kinase-like predicted kinase